MTISSGIIHVRFLNWFSQTHNSYICQLSKIIQDSCRYIIRSRVTKSHRQKQLLSIFLCFMVWLINFYIHSTVLVCMSSLKKIINVIITEAPYPYASDYNQKINIIAKSIYRSRGPFCHCSSQLLFERLIGKHFLRLNLKLLRLL